MSSSQPIERHLIATADVLPDYLRPIFPFQLFNKMQTLVVRDAFQSTDNITVAAPTGSGKTVVMELALCRFVADERSRPRGIDRYRCVYLSPSKALCQQKATEWSRKFPSLGHNVVELTGDVDTQDALSRLTNVSIIVTTPEKWDSVTRSWREYSSLLGSVRLLLIDEVHHLNEVRGSVLELVIVRMRFLVSYLDDDKENTCRQSNNVKMRIVALSATLPNVTDIGDWLGCKPTCIHFFDDTFRPVPLQVHTFSYGPATNPYLFDRSLNSKVGDLVSRYSNGQQTLIFCTSKTGTETLAGELFKDNRLRRTLTGHAREHAQHVSDSSLKSLVSCGIAYHHAGVPATDRLIIEQLFLSGDVHVLCATTTLAYGVNLPAHLVIVKGTYCWRGSTKGYETLPWSDVIQMVGRAGRPGFDRFGVAVIMTNEENASTFSSFSANAGMVKSKLPSMIHEALNAEIAQRVILSATDACRWLRGTFFFVCLTKNRYSREETQQLWSKTIVHALSTSKSPDEALFNLSERIISDLLGAGIVCSANMQSSGHKPQPLHIEPLQMSMIMSRHLTKFNSMKILLAIPSQCSMMQVLHSVSKCEELERPVRRSDKRVLNEMLRSVRFPVKSRVQLPEQKAFVLLQGAVARVPIRDFTLKVEQADMVENAVRLLSCAQELSVVRETGGMLLEWSILIERALKLRVWESPRPNVFGQCKNLTATTVDRISSRPDMNSVMTVFGTSAQVLQDSLECPLSEAEAIVQFTTDLAHSMMTVDFRLAQRSITIDVSPSLRLEPQSRRYSSLVSYQLVCYDVSTQRLLCYRRLPPCCISISYTVSIAQSAGPVLPHNVRCCLLSSVVGLDSIVGCGLRDHVETNSDTKKVKSNPIEVTKPAAATDKELNTNSMGPCVSSSSVVRQCDKPTDRAFHARRLVSDGIEKFFDRSLPTSEEYNQRDSPRRSVLHLPPDRNDDYFPLAATIEMPARKSAVWDNRPLSPLSALSDDAASWGNRAEVVPSQQVSQKSGATVPLVARTMESRLAERGDSLHCNIRAVKRVKRARSPPQKFFEASNPKENLQHFSSSSSISFDAGTLQHPPENPFSAFSYDSTKFPIHPSRHEQVRVDPSDGVARKVTFAHVSDQDFDLAFL